MRSYFVNYFVIKSIRVGCNVNRQEEADTGKVGQSRENRKRIEAVESDEGREARFFARILCLTFEKLSSSKRFIDCCMECRYSCR